MLARAPTTYNKGFAMQALCIDCLGQSHDLLEVAQGIYLYPVETRDAGSITENILNLRDQLVMRIRQHELQKIPVSLDGDYIRLVGIGGFVYKSEVHPEQFGEIFPELLAKARAHNSAFSGRFWGVADLIVHWARFGAPNAP